ncbi:MAG: hypothetical protein ABFS18_09970 [Thermodesulfobacteriota bacterium]
MRDNGGTNDLQQVVKSIVLDFGSRYYSVEFKKTFDFCCIG